MGHLGFCSNCGKKNMYGYKEGLQRYFCSYCNIIHYENPKPTATLVCPRGEKILLVKRAFNPGKGLWCLPGGFMEKGETAEQAAIRELKEETMLSGTVLKTLGTCSHFNTIFGDILLIGLLINIIDWSQIVAGDDAEEAVLFNKNTLPEIAFPCHVKILEMYNKLNNE